MRLFLAIFPPEEVLEFLKGIQRDLNQFNKFLKFTEPELIHITLKFLGSDVSRDCLEEFLPLLKQKVSCFEQFNVRIHEARFGFPDQRWPRILYVSVKNNERIDKLSSTINAAIEGLDLPDILSEKWLDKPTFHFTIARTKSRITESVIFDIRRKLKQIELWEGFLVKKIKLVESSLYKEGPKYEVIEELELGK
ncbi:RNA 2',3'-cyclic phosphodiesterase [Candidatus Dojkabacteria bacterium]|nr:RNA 2',3'-cyclic phosphodiesterase [Candidatus Dojkabacteria bacterium]